MTQSKSRSSQQQSSQAVPQGNKNQPQRLNAFALEPILTPSGILDTPDGVSDVDDIELPNYVSDDAETNDYSTDLGSDDPDDLAAYNNALDDSNLEVVPFADLDANLSPFESGVFTVDESGGVGIDFLFDSGAYQGEVAIFSLDGMDHLEPGSSDFIHEAAQRAVSNSNLGHIVIAEPTEGARFSGSLGEGTAGNFNSGDYQGVKTFTMSPGDEFGIMLVPNGTVEQLVDNPDLSGSYRPLFSMATANPDDALQAGQLVDVTGSGNTFVFEDLRVDGGSDRDYNDIIFQVRGATGEAALMDDLVADGKDWRTTDLGQALVEYAKPYIEADDAGLIDSTNLDAIASDLEDIPPENQPLIGVIDTGFAANNPDLDYDNITLGSDRVDSDNNPLLAEGEGNEHGTHVLGIIAAEQDNGIGIDGINDDAPVWIGRGIGGGNWAESLMEFADASDASGQQNGVVNLSIDLTQIDEQGNVFTRYELTPKERAAIEYARQRDILIVVSAGNDNGVMSALGQASQEFDNIITVGSADRILEDPTISDAEAYLRASYSSYGYGLDIVAEGGTVENPVLSTVSNGIGTMAGTSVATARVTGAVSQVWATNPDLSYRQVIDLLKNTATDLSTSNWDAETGAGLLNVGAAISMARTMSPDSHTAPASWIPDTWSGAGTFTPSERAVQIYQTGTFTGAVTATLGANLRAGASTNHAEVGSAEYGTQLTYDAWTRGEFISYPGLGADDRWYRITGTNSWISAAITTGEPPVAQQPSPPVVPPPSSAYYADLASLSDAQWNEYTKDNTRFDVGWPDYRDERHLTPESIRNIYTDLSNALFGKQYAVTAGYLLDPGYRQGIGKWHSGLDIDTPNWEPVKAVVGGRTTLIQNKAGDYFVGVQGDDGKLWVYGHLGDYSKPIGSRIEAGEVIGRIGSIGSHLHLEVQQGPNYRSSQSADLSIVGSATLNPIKSFWELKNANGNTGGNNGGGTTTGTPIATPGQQTTYRIKPGDTLWDIARRYLGDGNRWREIQKSPGGPGFTSEEARRLQVGSYVYIPVNYTSGGGGRVTNPPANGSIAGMTPYVFGSLGTLDDTLWEIAERELGSGFRWKEIRKADGTTFTSDEARRISRGTTVYLPNGTAPQPDPIQSPLDPETPPDNEPVPITSISETLRFEVEDASLYNTPGRGWGVDFDAQFTVKPEKKWEDLPLGMELALEASFNAGIYAFLSAGTADVGLSGDFDIGYSYDPTAGSTTLLINSAVINPFFPYLSTYLGFGAGFGIDASVKGSLNNIPLYGDLSAEISNGFDITAEDLLLKALAPGTAEFISIDAGFNLNTNLWDGNSLEADDNAGVTVDLTKIGGASFKEFLNFEVDLGIKQESKAILSGFRFDVDEIDDNGNDFLVELGSNFQRTFDFEIDSLRVLPELNLETSFSALAKGTAGIGVSGFIEDQFGNNLSGNILGTVLGGIPPKFSISREINVPLPFTNISTNPFANRNKWESIALV